MIELRSVVKKYGRKKVLQGVSFTAEKGEITCLLGINGVGKSSTLKSIMGLTPIHKGEILVGGESVKGSMYERISFVPDKQYIIPQFTISEAFDYMNDFYEGWNQEKAERILEFFKLEKGQRITDLSHGNQAKVKLVLGLARNVEYILMDEPFSGIDILSREQILKVFSSDFIGEDQAVLITTHEIQEFEHLIDKVIFLDHGIVTKEFYPEEVRVQEGKSVIDVMREVYS